VYEQTQRKKNSKEETAPSTSSAGADSAARKSARRPSRSWTRRSTRCPTATTTTGRRGRVGQPARAGGRERRDLLRVGRVRGAEDEASDEEDEDEDEDDEDEDRGRRTTTTTTRRRRRDEADFVVHDADAEDRAEEFERMRAQSLAPRAVDAATTRSRRADSRASWPSWSPSARRSSSSRRSRLQVKALADILGEDKGWVQVAVEELAKEFNERNGGLMLREVAGGWQFATRPEHHEHVRAYLKSKPSAKLSLAALETLAVIAYKQPVTVPEILEIRGVQSSSAIKTLLDKRLIIAKGRKETVGRPMMYGTSKDFLLQFGLKRPERAAERRRLRRPGRRRRGLNDVTLPRGGT
jgi:segregation and condensation protein B